MSLFPLLDLLPHLALGAALGFMGGLFGIGGGIIAVPVLVIAYGMDQAMAQGTSLAMMVPVLVAGWWRYSQHHPVAWRPALHIGLLASCTTYVVARFATGQEQHTLRAAFGIFLVLLAFSMMVRRRTPLSADGSSKLDVRFMPLVGILGGTSMGLLGIGGGLIATPILTSIFGQRQTSAQSLSLALVTPCSIIALFTYGRAGSVEWSMGIPMAAGGLLTVSAGVAIAHRLPERLMRQAFSWLILATAIWLLVRPLLMK